MEAAYGPTKKDLRNFYIMLGVIFGLPLAILVAIGIERGDLFNEAIFFVFGLMLLVVIILLSTIRNQTVTLSDSELSFHKSYFRSKRLAINQITAIAIGFGPRMARHFYVSTDNGVVEIVIGIWGEDAIVSFLRALQDKNPKIRIDDRYQKAMDLFGTEAYKQERKAVEKNNTRIVMKMALWSLAWVIAPLALLILWTLVSDFLS